MKYRHGRGVARALLGAASVRAQFLLVACVFGVAVTATSLNFGANYASAVIPGDNIRISVDDTGGQLTRESHQGSISRDGRYAVFLTRENNVAGVDWGYDADAFVRAN